MTKIIPVARMLILGGLTLSLAACEVNIFAGDTPSNAAPSLPDDNIGDIGDDETADNDIGGDDASGDDIDVGGCLVDLSSAEAPRRADLRTYLRFDGTLEDVSGNEVVASGNGGAQVVSSAPDWNSDTLALDGLDDWVSVGLDVNSMTSMTVSMWTRITKAADGAGMMLFGNDDGDFDFGLTMTSDESAWFWYPHLGSENNDSNTGIEALSQGAWHHVAMVYSADNVRVYKDGVEAWSLGYAAASPSGSSDLSIGRSNYQGFSDGHSYLSGYVDDFAVWNSALSPTEISTLASRSCVE